MAGLTATANDPARVLSAIQDILDHLPELPLSAGDRATIEADAKAVAAQLASPAPKHGVVRQLLDDIASKVKGALSADVAAQTVKVVESAAGMIAGYVQSATM